MPSSPTVCVLGSINLDVVLRVARFPLAGETVLASGLAHNLGGKGANQAVAAARAGAAVRMIGCVGDDEDGRRLVAMLAAEGVDCAAILTDLDQPTGTAHILVDDTGENQIVVVSGANETVCDSTPGEAHVLLAQLESPLDAVRAFLSAKTVSVSATTILNAAPYDPASRPLFALADLIVVNETELAGYCGEREPPRSSEQAARMARSLLHRADQKIVVTLGAAGSVTVGTDASWQASAPAAQVVDTTGAGDCFCGYVAAGIAAGKALAEAVADGHRAGAIAVGRPGAAASIPFLAELAEPPADPRVGEPLT